jgi:homocysteine S-methyltransferase
MTADEAERYHSAQIETLADAGADMIAGLTLTYPEEAIGIARAAGRAGIPVAVSFTVETDGRLPGSHAELDEAEELDEGDPAELAAQYRTLRALLPTATVVGGCCGTDHRHVAALVDAWLDAA